ncbi:hypothetical protein FHR81_005562 [Actinoalloteichus hoggarensis]|uniref:Uncharacterized protein n=1 Tax=Actinoalloteichus hoggarensis TaxID=1470176 RepID=A0A221W467_9PSEU|nr:lantibiotic dehydratase [Actinoalloteichus hoggarensis]ASO20670.1 hypothetical protein AHOG_15220 [Actinoalloteichus hoggarensis]MBB5924477.1 hypothetical protein [Actinoalloteichus hoggarensis]
MPRAADTNLRIAGHGVTRVCSLPASVLERLRSRTLTDLADELRSLDEHWARSAPAAAAALTALVPVIVDRRRRASVLALRRRLNRALPVEGADISRALDHGVEPPWLQELTSLADRRSVLRERFVAVYDESWADERQALAELGGLHEIRASAQLTSDGLLRNIDRYRAEVDAGRGHDKRSRTTEATLVNLISRSALKPSPFGQLVHVRPVEILTETPAPQPADLAVAPIVHSVCRLPRQLVEWVHRSVAAHPMSREQTVLRRAPVVALSAEVGSFFVRGRDGTNQPAARERIVRVRRGAVLDVILAEPEGAPISETVLRRRVEEFDDGPDVLDQLIDDDVLARDLGIDEQDPDPMSTLVERLTPEAPAELREPLTALLHAEKTFGRGTPEDRVRLLKDIQRRTTEVALACRVAEPPLSVARTLIYDDGVVTRPLVESAARWTPHSPALTALHRLVPLFDDDAHVRAIVAEVVTELFGSGPHRLLPLYTALSAPKARAALGTRLLDLSAPVPTALRAIQDRVLAEAPYDTDADEVTIGIERLTALSEQAPSWVSSWPRVSWNLQRGSVMGRERLVVNAGAIGYGRAMSRFLTSFAAAEPTSARIVESMRAELTAEDDPASPLTDLAGVLGINGNVHPALLPRHLGYPCGTSGGWSGDRVSLEDCWVRTNDGTLELWQGRDGRRLRLIPLNFLLNDLAPQLYRFLGFFAMGSLANFSWWDRVDQRRPDRAGIRRYPRVRVGDVILDRRTWKIPRTELPDQTGPDRARSHLEIRRWQHANGLPDQVFYRQLTLPDPMVPMDVGENGVPSGPVRFPTAAERKPVLLDFTSVTGVAAWQRALRKVHADMTFQECLPLPAESPTEHVNEYVVETIGGRHV